MGTTAKQATYVLGHSATEQRRLDQQGEILRPYSRRFLQDAGVELGMRVLDVGCGTGDLTLLLAEMVGPGGRVIGIDRSADVLETVRSRIRAQGLEHVGVVAEDIATVRGIGPFDAVVGRLVLMHQADPLLVLRNLIKLVRPGGLVAFQENVIMNPAVGASSRPLLCHIGSLARAALATAGSDPDFGLKLHRTFRAAGLRDPRVRLDPILGHGADAGYVAYRADTIRALLPSIEAFGIATAAEVDVDTLEARLLAEADHADESFFAVALGGAWARTP